MLYIHTYPTFYFMQLKTRAKLSEQYIGNEVLESHIEFAQNYYLYRCQLKISNIVDININYHTSHSYYCCFKLKLTLFKGIISQLFISDIGRAYSNSIDWDIRK